MNASQYKYRGFISYSHQDRRWGEWLHRALERYCVPTRLVGTDSPYGPVPKRLFPIFRDREELPTAGALGEALGSALASSLGFVLVCSPAAAQSRWVNEEVLQFKRLGGERRVLCLIIDGEPNATDAGHPERECFPPALRFKLDSHGEVSNEPAEPLAADARAGGDGRDHARLKIIAGLLGVSLGELRQRDLQARNRRLGIIAAITTGVAALTLVLALQAMLARRAAERSRQQGEDLIGFMLGDLRTKLEPLGKLEILDAVGDKAMGYFDQLDNRNLSEAALIARAKALRQIGDVRFQQGRPADAATAIDAALPLNRELARRHPDDADLQFELGQTEFWVAFTAFRANQLERAAEHFAAYQAISQGLVDRDPKNADWHLELCYAENNLAALDVSRKEYASALAHAQRAAALLEAMNPQSDRILSSLANAYSWQGTALQRLGRLPEAIELLRRQADMARSLADARPDDLGRKYQLGQKLSALGFAALAGADASVARAASRDGVQLSEALVQNEARNMDYRYLLAAQLYIAAGVEFVDENIRDAQLLLERSRSLLQEVLTRDGARNDARQLMAASNQMMFDLALRTGRLNEAASIVAQGERSCPGALQDATPAADPKSCVRNALRRWELSLVQAEAPSAVVSARSEFERAVQRADLSADGILKELVLAQAAVLDGRTDEASQGLQALMRTGYRPVDLDEFIRRHCRPRTPLSNDFFCSAQLLPTFRRLQTDFTHP